MLQPVRRGGGAHARRAKAEEDVMVVVFVPVRDAPALATARSGTEYPTAARYPMTACPAPKWDYTSVMKCRSLVEWAPLKPDEPALSPRVGAFGVIGMPACACAPV